MAANIRLHSNYSFYIPLHTIIPRPTDQGFSLNTNAAVLFVSTLELHVRVLLGRETNHSGERKSTLCSISHQHVSSYFGHKKSFPSCPISIAPLPLINMDEAQTTHCMQSSKSEFSFLKKKQMSRPLLPFFFVQAAAFVAFSISQNVQPAYRQQDQTGNFPRK